MRLTAYLDGRRVGWFAQRGAGDIVLEFDPVWQRAPKAVDGCEVGANAGIHRPEPGVRAN